MTTALSRPTPPMVVHSGRGGGARRGDQPDARRVATRRRSSAAKEAIRAGECFQIVVAQRFERATDGRPARRLPGAAGHQPEPVHVPAALRRLRRRRLVAGGAPGQGRRRRRALLHPIAGTRSRGATPGGGPRAGRRAARRPEGARRARDARRPGPQRSRPGVQAGHRRGAGVRPRSSGTATSCTSCRRSSGSCATERTAFDALAATFPAGTLSGAPKVRAMEIIEELEPTRRGLYGGAVGYFGFGGDMDMAIAIRTALMRDGRGLRAGRRAASSPTRTRSRRSRRPGTRPPPCWRRSRRPRPCGRPDERPPTARPAGTDQSRSWPARWRSALRAVRRRPATWDASRWSAGRRRCPPLGRPHRRAPCCRGCRRWPWSASPARARSSPPGAWPGASWGWCSCWWAWCWARPAGMGCSGWPRCRGGRWRWPGLG